MACALMASRERSRSPPRAMTAAEVAEAVEPDGQSLGDFAGIDFTVLGREQKAEFVDSQGKRRKVYVFLPKCEDAPEEGFPAVVYFHSLGYETPIFESAKVASEGIQVAQKRFVLLSPIVPGIKDKDSHFNTPAGAEAVQWLSELIFTVAACGLPGPDGRPRVDTSRISTSGVSLGGALTYLTAARCSKVLCGAVPVAGYHFAQYQDALAEGLSRLPLFCVHSSSPTERTCPIENERPLWKKTQSLGGSFELKEVHCKHGKTFSHAYEIDTKVWDWLLKQQLDRS